MTPDMKVGFKSGVKGFDEELKKNRGKGLRFDVTVKPVKIGGK